MKLNPIVCIGRKDETGVALEDVLAFFTAHDKVPPLGFTKNPTLGFSNGVLATGNTCAGCLSVPVAHADYDSFKEFMILSVLNVEFNSA